jgi:phosphoribosylformimino-5-aminoimidazole carboxamide ribonucleotide (ProFAR) isomerase
MILIPAVDLREGRCVRLREGRDDARTVFSDDPVSRPAAACATSPPSRRCWRPAWRGS